LQEKKLQEFEKQVNKLQNTERELRGELSLVRQSVLHLESDNEKLKERLAQVRLMTMGMGMRWICHRNFCCILYWSVHVHNVFRVRWRRTRVL
jgi:hypothetical protein